MKIGQFFRLYHLQNLTYSSKTAQNRALCDISFERGMIGLNCVKKSSGALWCVLRSGKFKYKDREKNMLKLTKINFFQMTKNINL